MPKSNTLFPWPGGKTRLLPHILPLLERYQHQCYVEAFAGGAAVLFARSPAKVEVLNDTHGELVRLYRVVANHLDEFVKQFKWLLTAREEFDRHKRQPPECLTDIQRAARFYYLQRLAFGGKVSGQTFGTCKTGPKRLDLTRLGEDLTDAHLRLHRVVVENLPWADCVARYDSPSTLFFFDPPYWKTEGYGVPFGLAEYDKLAEVMGSMEGRAILTINDHPEMRKRFDRFPGTTVPIRYKIGGGAGKEARERIYVSRRD